MLPIWLLAELMIMIYYWRFWEPWAGSMLVVLLPKLWFWIGNHDWHNCLVVVVVVSVVVVVVIVVVVAVVPVMTSNPKPKFWQQDD